MTAGLGARLHLVAGEPRLWLRRLVLLKAPDFSAVIRDIPLKRGLNIVLGFGEETEDTSDELGSSSFIRSGHSVGKTTFCRLVRHILGEDTFGTKRAQERIRSCFPQGWVAAEVVVDGSSWAVARPFSTNSLPKTKPEARVEDLFAPNFAGVRMDEYQAALARLLPPHCDLPSMTFEWRHLLAWLSRDQEARLRNFWTWRESDAESGVRFKKPVEHPKHLARGVLKLLSPEIQELEDHVTELHVCHKQAVDEREQLENEPRLRQMDLKRRLSQLLPNNPPSPIDNSKPMFSLEMLVKNELLRLRSEIKAREQDLDATDDKISRLDSVLRSKEKEISLLLAAEERRDAMIEVLKDDDDPDEKRLQKLEQEMKDQCAYVPEIKIEQCQYAIDYLAKRRARKNVSKIGTYKDQMHGQRAAQELQQENEAAKADLAQERSELSSIQAFKDKLRLDRTRIRSELDDLERKCEDLSRICEEYGNNEAILAGTVENHELSKAQEEEATLAVDLADAEARLKKARQDALVHGDTVREVFSDLVRYTFGAAYSGDIQHDNDLCFRVLESGEQAGAVVDTLATILGDITAMLCAGHGASYHPGFLIHDSPREADLNHRLYTRLLTLMWTVTSDCGGPVEAPFQYILTTTTKPPDDAAKSICLQMKAWPEKEMLLGRRLNCQSELEQGVLEFSTQ